MLNPALSRACRVKRRSTANYEPLFALDTAGTCERNQHLLIAISLRRLFNNKAWLSAHTVEGSRQRKRPQKRGHLGPLTIGHHGRPDIRSCTSKLIIPQWFRSYCGTARVRSALVVASLFGATAIASAQTQSTAGEGAGMGSQMAPHKMKSSHDHKRYTRAEMDKSRPGGRPISNKPAS